MDILLTKVTNRSETLLDNLMILKRIILLLLIISGFSYGTMSAENEKSTANSDFLNYRQLVPLFEKLYKLEHSKTGKINIVHIGDSHIQADLFTNSIRQALQSRFGNGGYGFCFPYSLAKTNGTGYTKLTSNTVWNNRRNIFPVTDVSIGLSGIGFYTNKENFSIQLDVNPLYSFNKIKVLSTFPDANFRVSFSDYVENTPQKEEDTHPVTKEKLAESEVKIHTVKKGETLYRIAQHNHISVEQLKELNDLKSNVIKRGMVLVVSEKKKTKPKEKAKAVPMPETVKQIQQTDKSKPLSGKYYVEAKDSILYNTAYITAKSKQAEYNLSGIIIENNKPGVIYHSIGVNGAKLSDYNKYPLFFKQLPLLNPDLIIISLGTNESFGKWSTPYYMDQLNQFIQNIHQENPSAIVLVTTPPPSLFRRRTPNEFIEGYRDEMMKSEGYVVWDLLAKLGGIAAPLNNNLSENMARDRVHYTKDGYEEQGVLFATDFLKAYDQYIKNRVSHQ